MKIDLSRFEAAFSALPRGVKAAEVNAELRDCLSVGVKSGRMTGCEANTKTILYLRASDGERSGMVYTERLQDDPALLITAAMAGAEVVQPGKSCFNSSGRYEYVTGGAGQSSDELLAAAALIEECALATPGVTAVTECEILMTLLARRVINSYGFDSYAENTFFTATLEVEMSRGGGKTVSASIAHTSATLAGLDAKALAAAAAEKACASDRGGELPDVAFPSGMYSAVLTPDVVCSIMTTAWQAFVGTYMRDGATVYPPVPGTKIGPAILNIVDRPSYPGHGYDLRIDCQGTLCQSKHVVEKGLLKTPLLNLESAESLGLPPTGNAGRMPLLSGTTQVNIVTAPSVIYIEPGLNTVSELTAAMGDGIVLTYALDAFHSLNIASGEFSIPCGGIVFKGGKPAGVANQLTMAGNLRDLFMNIRAIANDLKIEEFFYKNYCYGGPSVLVDGLVFGSMS